jgi:hypothetical protein
MIKFLYNGIKKDDKLYKASYYKGSYTKESSIPEGTITIFAKEYGHFPNIEGLEKINETDIMTDYFEKDRIHVQPDNQYYNDVNAAYLKQEEHDTKRYNKYKAAY